MISKLTIKLIENLNNKMLLLEVRGRVLCYQLSPLQNSTQRQGDKNMINLKV